MLRKCCRRGRLTQRRSGRSQVVAVLLIVDEATQVRRRRCAADFERQQSHFVLYTYANFGVVLLDAFAFCDLTLLVGHQEERPACEH